MCSFADPWYEWSQHQPHSCRAQGAAPAAPGRVPGSGRRPQEPAVDIRRFRDHGGVVARLPERPRPDRPRGRRCGRYCGGRPSGHLQSQRQPAGHSAAAGSEFSRTGLEYVAGFLAIRLHAVDSSLGTMSSQCPPGGAGADCPWLERLNRGALYRPSLQAVAAAGGGVGRGLLRDARERHRPRPGGHQAPQGRP